MKFIIVMLIFMVLSQIVGCGSLDTTDVDYNKTKQTTTYKIQTIIPIKNSVYVISDDFKIKVLTKISEPKIIPEDNRDWEFKTLPFKGELKESWNIDLTNYPLTYNISDYWARSDKEGWLIAIAKLDNKYQFKQLCESYIDPYTGVCLPIPVVKDIFYQDSNKLNNDTVFFGNLAFKRYEDCLKCFDINSGDIYWDKSYHSDNLLIIGDYLFIDKLQYDKFNKSDYKIKTTKINPYNGKIIWEITSDDFILRHISCNNNGNGFFDSSKYLWLYNSTGRMRKDCIYRFDPDTLEVYKVNIDNIQCACSFRNLICIIDTKNKLIMIEPTTGTIKSVTDIGSVTLNHEIFEIYPFKDKLYLSLYDINIEFKTSILKLILLDPFNIKNYIDISNKYLIEWGLGIIQKTLYFKTDKELYGIDEKTGQKSWWIPKSLGVKDIKIIENRGILAFVEKGDFKGLVCFGQK